jgi:ELWxxDGT repeat protein
MNGTLLFTANDGIYGKEVWKSDGTEIGTAIVKDINPTGGPLLQDFADVNGTLFFSATDGVDFGLWTSDGTANGTTLAFSFADKFGGLDKLTHAGGTLFFTANDRIHGSEVWKSDGTFYGTIMVKDIQTGGWPYYLTSVNNTLFFVADDGIHGHELWKSDGTEAGTVMVKDINPSGDASLAGLTNVNGTLFFRANDGVHGTELWRSDGTEIGTVMVKDINPSGDALPGKLTVVDGKLFFTADDGVHGKELWATETIDSCPDDSNKLDPGMCGCGVAETDTDSDGYPDCIDCSSDDPTSHPLAPEVYDGVDNNCNGWVDEGPPGQDVVVEPQDCPEGIVGGTPVTVTFDRVDLGGNTTLCTSSTGPLPPSEFRPIHPRTYYEINTTTIYTGNIQICIANSGVKANSKLFHWEDPGGWEDVTCPTQDCPSCPGPDPGNDICGCVNSLSTFAILQPVEDEGPAVGGVAEPINKIQLLIPWITLATLILLPIGVVVFRRVKK